jgi:hypothetical protein
MNGTGPDGQGSATGRGMGKCKKSTDEEAFQKLGKGMGQRRKAGGGSGKGKRLKNDQK